MAGVTLPLLAFAIAAAVGAVWTAATASTLAVANRRVLDGLREDVGRLEERIGRIESATGLELE